MEPNGKSHQSDFDQKDLAKRQIKCALRVTLGPLLRALQPTFENLRRIRSYLILSSRVKLPVDESVVLLGVPEVRGTGDIRFGRNVLLYPDLYLETQPGASIQIDTNVVISRGVHIVARAGITIGAGTMIGEYSSIRDANHSRESDGALREGGHTAAPIAIGSQVWVGRGVTILPGVTIGDNATVGANAVVTHDVPAGVTVVGVPAAPIRSSRRNNLRVPFHGTKAS